MMKITEMNEIGMKNNPKTQEIILWMKCRSYLKRNKLYRKITELNEIVQKFSSI